MSFDEEDDYIEIGDVLIDGWSELTVLAWVYPLSLGTITNPTGHDNQDEHPVVHKAGSDNDNFGITLCEGGTAFYLDDGADHTITGSTVSTDTWTHVGCVHDGTMHIYLNGELDTEGETVGTITYNTNSFRIGGRHEYDPTDPFYFDGPIGWVLVCDRALSGNEVSEFHEDTKPLYE